MSQSCAKSRVYSSGCGQLTTDLSAHLGFKCIVSCCFHDKRMRLKTRAYSIILWQLYNAETKIPQVDRNSMKVLLVWGTNFFMKFQSLRTIFQDWNSCDSSVCRRRFHCVMIRAWQNILFFSPIILFDYSKKLSPLFPFGGPIILMLKGKLSQNRI